MKRILFALILAGLAVDALARPVPLRPTATLQPPAPYQARAATINGDDVFMLASADRAAVVLQFSRQANGSWQYVRQIYSNPTGYNGDTEDIKSEGDVLGVLLSRGRLLVFERSGTQWLQSAVVDPPESDYIFSTSVTVEGGHIAVGSRECSSDSIVFSRNSAGAWEMSGRLEGLQASDCRFPDTTHPAAVLDGDLALSTWIVENTNDQQLVWYRNSPSGSATWIHFGTASDFPGRFASSVAIRDDHSFASAEDGVRVFVHTPDGGIGDGAQTRLRPLDSGMISVTHGAIPGFGGLVARDGWLISGILTRQGDHRLDVWRPSGTNTFENVALTYTGVPNSHFGGFDVSDHTLLAPILDTQEHATVYLFELPDAFATPAPRQEDFQSNSASHWQPLLASQLTVTQSGNSRVYRQSNLSGDTGALLNDSDWKDQSVQADLRLSAFQGSDGFIGLVSRYQNFNNYYYVSLRNGNQLSLRKKVGGVVTVLAAATLPAANSLVPGRSYRLRLDTVGEYITAEVDGIGRLHATDGSLTHGSAGFRGYRASYDVDNVLLSPLSSNLFRIEPGVLVYGATWQSRGGSWTFPPGFTLQQTGSSDAFAFIGESTDNQIVVSTVRVDEFNAASSAAWAGVMARYVDHINFYHLILRKNNRLQLRKMVNGVTTILAERALTVTPGKDYLLRLDATGGRLRGYVNGVLQFEVSDGSLPSGRAGLATYQTKATYGTYEAYQP